MDGDGTCGPNLGRCRGYLHLSLSIRGHPTTRNRPHSLPGVSGQLAPLNATPTHPHCPRAREAVSGPEHCQGQGAGLQPRAQHPTHLGASLQAPMHRVPRPRGIAGSFPPTWPSPGAELLPSRPGLPRCPRKDAGCGERVVGVRCRGLTCETPESPSGWTWSPPGSAEGPAHSALSSSSGTRGLQRDKVAALKG